MKSGWRSGEARGEKEDGRKGRTEDKMKPIKNALAYLMHFTKLYSRQDVRSGGLWR